MAQLKLNKINIIDFAVAVAVILVVAIGAIYYIYKPDPVRTELRVTVRVGNTEVAKAILTQAKTDKVVYLNSLNSGVNVLGVQEVLDDGGQFAALDIILEGPGYISDGGNYIFNGQRILINQKAEIHANYFARGGIVKIENAN